MRRGDQVSLDKYKNSDNLVIGIVTDRDTRMKYVHPRDTKQMRLIRDIIYKDKAHPTATDIFVQARKAMPHISLGTVYRNLDKLIEAKQIVKFASGEKRCRYDAVEEAHFHIRCEKCGLVKDLKCGDMDKVCQQVRKECDFTNVTVRLEMTGHCPRCSMKDNGE